MPGSLLHPLTPSRLPRTPALRIPMPLSISRAATAALGALVLATAHGALAQHVPDYVVAAANAAMEAPGATDSPAAPEPCPEWRQCGMGKSMKCCRPDQECWSEWFDYTCHNKTESRPQVGKFTSAVLQRLFASKTADAAAVAGPLVKSVDKETALLRGGTTCSRCLIHNCCSSGLACRVDGHDGACTTCTGRDETRCGDKCCNGGEECHGDPSSGYSCTEP